MAVEQGDHGPRAVDDPFLGMAIEFIAVRQARMSRTFLILVALAFVDVIGGFTIRPPIAALRSRKLHRVVTG